MKALFDLTLLGILIIAGFIQEDKVIAFEEKAIKKVAEMLAHFKRLIKNHN